MEFIEGYFGLVHLSTTDILISVVSIDVAVCGVAGTVLILRRRLHPRVRDNPHAQPATPNPAPPNVADAFRPGLLVLPEETGRHHIPEGLLDAPTTRLTPEVLSRVDSSRHHPDRPSEYST